MNPTQPAGQPTEAKVEARHVELAHRIKVNPHFTERSVAQWCANSESAAVAEATKEMRDYAGGLDTEYSKMEWQLGEERQLLASARTQLAAAEAALVEAKADSKRLGESSAALFLAAEDGRQILEDTTRAIMRVQDKIPESAARLLADDLRVIWDAEKMKGIRETVLKYSKPADATMSQQPGRK
jgi:hypothetical protein